MYSTISYIKSQQAAEVRKNRLTAVFSILYYSVALFILFRPPMNDSIEIIHVVRVSSPVKCSHLRLKSNYPCSEEHIDYKFFLSKKRLIL